MPKVFSIRLADEHVAQLDTLATFDGVAIAEEIREAITLLLKSRSQDPNFARRVKDAYESARKMLSDPDLERGQELITALGDPVAEVEPPTAMPEVARAERVRPSVPVSAPAPAPARKVARKIVAAAGRVGSR